MGCDMYSVLQVREPHGPWRTIDPPTTARRGFESWETDPVWETRSYPWYGYLAGVREPSAVDEPLAPARGIPPDAELDHELGDHGRSWVGLDELAGADLTVPYTGARNTWAGETIGDVVGWIVSRTLDALTPLGDPQDIRIVFGFDS